MPRRTDTQPAAQTDVPPYATDAPPAHRPRSRAADRGAGGRPPPGRRRRRGRARRRAVRPVAPRARSCAGRRRRSPRCIAESGRLLDGGVRRVRGAPAELRGHPGGDQQVGVVVRPVPRRVPGVPARGDRARTRGRLPGTELGRQPATRRALPGQLPDAVSRPTSTRRGHRPRARGRRPTTRSRCSSTQAASRRSSTRAPTASSADSRRTSIATWAGAVGDERHPRRPAHRPQDDHRRRTAPARPGDVVTVAPPSPIDPATDPFAEGHEHRRRPRSTPCVPAAARPTRRGGASACVPNLYPALGWPRRPHRRATPNPTCSPRSPPRARTR